MSTAFRLTLELATPFALTHPMTLDGLLSAAVFRQTGKMGKDTIPHIPLLREEGIFHGSSLHHGKLYRHDSVGRVMSLRTEADLSVHLFAPNRKRGDGYMHIDQKRGAFKANMSSYPAIAVKEVFFWGVGDGEACAELIRCYLPGIGKRANAGAGEIRTVWLDASEDHSWITPKETPARPLPRELWQRIAGTEQPVMPLAVDLPYWESAPVEAVFPVSVVL